MKPAALAGVMLDGILVLWMVFMMVSIVIMQWVFGKLLSLASLLSINPSPVLPQDRKSFYDG